MAIEYAYRYREEYTAILWTSAATRELLIASFVTLAGLLNLAEKDAPDQMLTVEAVKGWFANHSGWLLILDNADDLVMASEFLPVGQTGHILLTTRAQAAGSIANSIPVENMNKEEGIHLLLKRARVLLPDTSVDQEAQSQARAIVDVLGGLPLAIDQAGAYIEESGCSLAQYLAFYRTRRKELLRRRSGLPTEHPEPVATTWSLSFQKVKEANPAASELLQVCAFLDADAIPEELFTKGAKHLGKVLSPVASDPYQLNEAIQVLRQYSLIRRQTHTHRLSIHRLVQAVLQDTMTMKQQRQWTERVIHALWEASPKVDYGKLSAYEPYLPHLLHGATLIDEYHLSFADAGYLLHGIGLYFYYRGRYPEVEPFYQRALKISEQALGGEHPDTAATLHELARLYQEQGQYEPARELYQRALQITEDVLGTAHPDTATTMQALASLYQEQGQYEPARELYQRALQITEDVLGAEHPDTAATMHQLANLYQEQGQYEASEELYQRALKIKEQVLGAEHPDTAMTQWGLAVLYERQGQYTRAEPLYRQALAIMEKVIPHHPYTTRLRESYHDLLREMERKG